MARHPDTIITPNTLLTEARERLPSPRRPGQRMSRPELADVINAALAQLYPGRDLTAHYVDRRWVGKLERGEHRWPRRERRVALRQVLSVTTDTDLGPYSPPDVLQAPSERAIDRCHGRRQWARLRYLVLADSVLVINELGNQHVISDGREAETGRRHRGAMDAVPADTAAHDDSRRAYVETLRAYRNHPGGFWVAAADPQAASEALTGEVDKGRAESVLLLSDGASRPADRFGLMTWDELAKLVSTAGCPALLRKVRDAENSDPRGRRWPKGKIYDDATVVYCDFR
ncbi:hypothetical protein [Micromonospora aurantiaca (nom. illeg.)]|uniref:hypothetical protein n=1 Tax=Micromonospora aurantiaca (nom. illeg.) TaxID=47850 RepID=UPI0033C574C2